MDQKLGESMLWRDYQVVIFKEDKGVCRQLKLKGFIFLTGILLAVSGLAANFIFADQLSAKIKMEKELSESEKRVKEQRLQLAELHSKLTDLENDLNQVRGLDIKLRTMLDLKKEPQNVAPMGNTTGDSLSGGSKLLYKDELMTRRLHNYLQALGDEVHLTRLNREEIVAFVNENSTRLSSNPTIWPTEGWISSEFGNRTSPFTGKPEFHNGLDINAPSGTPVLATAAGKIISVDNNFVAGLNLCIDHGNGVTTTYSHLDSSAVKAGDNVARGQVVGQVGSTGRTTGPHLHYEVRVAGVPTDPAKFILE